MKKYRCPKCKATFVGKLSICPNCNEELHYLDEEVKKDINLAKPNFHFEDEDVLNKGIEEEEERLQKLTREERRKKIEEEEVTKDAKRDVDGNLLSYYDGNWFAQFGLKLAAIIVTLCTVFIALPWTMCWVYRYQYKHTVIEGRRLYFDGKGVQLFGRYMLWLLLTIVTLLIFLIFLLIRLRKWKTKHIKIRKNDIM